MVCLYRKDPEKCIASNFQGHILFCAYTISQYGQISVFCTIHSGSFSPFSHVCFCIPFASICNIRVICDLTLSSLSHVIYTCYSTAYYQFLLCHYYFYLLRVCILYTSIEYTFFSTEISNKNIHKKILEILDQNRISIEVTFLYFSTNELKTE